MTRLGPEGGARIVAADIPDAKHFWSLVDRRAGARRCWPFGGSLGRNRYGNYFRHHIRLLAGAARAHRVAYCLTRGVTPAGQLVCHTCDNPPCCNPAHLFLGTSRDNARDMRAKGRRPGYAESCLLYCWRGHRRFARGVCRVCQADAAQAHATEQIGAAAVAVAGAASVLPLSRDALAASVGDRRTEITAKHFGLFGHRYHSLTELGLEYGLSRERIRQITNRVVELSGGTAAPRRAKFHATMLATLVAA